jgi:hypothetical protein
MSHRDNKELNDFSQKIRKEGPAGFGAGPWPDAAKIVKPAHCLGREQPATALPRQPDKPRACRLGDRILTGLAILSLGMLIVGAMGAYLSNESQHVATTTRSEPGAPSLLQDGYETRFGNLEKRLTDVNDLYEERFHALESKLAQAIDPYEARLSNMERRLEQANDPNDTRLRDVEARLEQLTHLPGSAVTGGRAPPGAGVRTLRRGASGPGKPVRTGLCRLRSAPAGAGKPVDANPGPL